jgi:methylglutaconyl-CoA hydratase
MPAATMSVDAGVATITLDDPERRNAFSVELTTALLDHLDAAVADDGVRAVVVTNTGPVFCAGADIGAVTALADRGIQPSDVFARILDAPKPTLGRIAGHCFGGGVGLAAAFDISVATTASTFGFTEARLGVAPAIVSVICLPKLRRGDASELFLRAHRFPAADAARLGLINHAVAEHQLDPTVRDVLADVMAGGPHALAACKELVRQVPSMPRDDAFRWASELSQQLFTGEEGREGVAAFREKRPARWVPQPID